MRRRDTRTIGLRASAALLACLAAHPAGAGDFRADVADVTGRVAALDLNGGRSRDAEAFDGVGDDIDVGGRRHAAALVVVNASIFF